MRLIDELIDLTVERAEIRAIESALRKNARALLEQQQRIDATEEVVRPLPGLREQIDKLESFFQEEMVRTQKLWQLEATAVSQAEERIGEVLGTLSSTFAEFLDALFSIQDDDVEEGEDLPNPDILERIDQVSKEYAGVINDHRTSLQEKLNELSRRVADVKEEWEGRFPGWRREYERRLAELGDEGAGLSSLYQKLERFRNEERDLARKEQALDETLRPGLTSLKDQRQELVGKLLAARNAVRDKRRAKAEDLTSRLGGRVRIRIDKYGVTDESFAHLRELRVGSRLSDADIQVMAKELHPALFVPTLLDRDFKTLAAKSGLPESKFERLIDVILETHRGEDLYEFQLVNPEDLVRFQFALEHQRYKELESLAHGQKCTVVLMIAMAEGDWPMIVDQPEDALHAPWIEENIVSRLREDRGGRQYIFATKSPGILVSADAEQVIALDSEADQGWIDKTGSIHDFDSRDMIVYHAEGGKDPLARRQLKYDLASLSRLTLVRGFPAADRCCRGRRSKNTDGFDGTDLPIWANNAPFGECTWPAHRCVTSGARHRRRPCYLSAGVLVVTFND